MPRSLAVAVPAHRAPRRAVVGAGEQRAGLRAGGRAWGGHGRDGRAPERRRRARAVPRRRCIAPRLGASSRVDRPRAALRAPAAGGEPLATLDGALALRRHGAPLPFNLDLKVVGVGPPLARALRAAGRRDSILLTGYAVGAFAQVREAEPWVCAALTRSARAVPLPLPARALARAAPPSGGRLLASRLVGEARVAGVGALALQHTLATPAVVRACHHAGVRVLVWTIDDPVRMRVLRAAGVDGVTTNRVDLLCALDPAL